MTRRATWMFVTFFGLLACQGTHRDFSAVSALRPSASSTATAGNAGTDAGGGADPSALDGQPGAACATASDCGSGFCVDGVCCRSSCDTVCSRCDAPGQQGDCTVSPNDAACGLSCPDSSDCRTYGSGALSANCEAIGLCRTLTDCTSTNAPSGTACGQGQGTCDGQGECIIAGKSRLGESCQADADCAQGHCVVGAGGAAMCCDAACTGLCQACGSDGHCNQTPRDDARCVPVDCPDDNLCRDYVPDITVNLCRGFGQCRTQVDCTFQELLPAAECSCGANGCQLTAGAACANPTDCASGACEATSAGAQVCCAQACAAQGLICAADGSGCVQCEGDGTNCQDAATSQVCSDRMLTSQTCGNGCDATAGTCSALRTTGSVCDGAAQCASNVCAIDVTGTNRCCSADCQASGRACGTDGSCVCPADRQDVNGTCLLKAGAQCTANQDCASGACAGTVSGGQVCCAQACGAGTFCASDGSACVQCEGATSTCQGNLSQRCEDSSLIQSQCGNGCNAATGVCNGLVATGQTCTGNAQCASSTCTPDIGGTMRCCTPNCAASGRVCGTDGSCVCANANTVFLNGQCREIEGQACRADTDCRSGACEPTQSGNQVCCTGACNGQICRANGQGCVACDGGAPSCQGNASRSCVNNAFVTTNCANGCNTATGQCNNLVARGGGCTQAAQCSASGSACQNGRCCEFDCAAAGRVCGADGTCGCPANTTLVGTACLFTNGQSCTRDNDCASGRCDVFFRDSDGDLHGDPNQAIHVCDSAGSAPPAGYVPSNDDCCDSDALAHPGQTAFQPMADACGSFDYDCDGKIEYFFENAIQFVGLGCNIPMAQCAGGITIWSPPGAPACGASGGITACNIEPAGLVPGNPITCTQVTGALVVNSCR